MWAQGALKEGVEGAGWGRSSDSRRDCVSVSAWECSQNTRRPSHSVGSIRASSGIHKFVSQSFMRTLSFIELLLGAWPVPGGESLADFSPLALCPRGAGLLS